MSTAGPVIQRVHKTNIHNEIVERLITYILEHGLRTGDRLPTERELSDMMGVGRSSLREATRSLAAMGVIRIMPRGMVVGGGESAVLTAPVAWGLLMNAHSAREVIEARGVVEMSLAERAAERATDKDLAELGEILERMRVSVSKPGEFVEHDLSFHLAVARAGHNVMLLHVVRTIQLVIRAWIEKVIEEYEHVPVSYDEHRRILEALASRDPVAAREAMGAHLQAAGERLLRTVPDDDAQAASRWDGASALTVSLVAPGGSKGQREAEG